MFFVESISQTLRGGTLTSITICYQALNTLYHSKKLSLWHPDVSSVCSHGFAMVQLWLCTTLLFFPRVMFVNKCFVIHLVLAKEPTRNCYCKGTLCATCCVVLSLIFQTRKKKSERAFSFGLEWLLLPTTRRRCANIWVPIVSDLCVLPNQRFNKATFIPKAGLESS